MEAFGRDDYRELCELIIKYLGGQVNIHDLSRTDIIYNLVQIPVDQDLLSIISM